MIQAANLDKVTTGLQEGKVNSKQEVKPSTAKVNIDQAEVKDDSQQKNSFMPKSITKVIEEVNKRIEPMGKKLEYSIHERTNQILIKVIDVKTNEVIKEIPDEKLMDIMADLCETSGILLDEKI